jgi:peptidoglycan/xylan/chitin deacetylase (PgdA/CDA1 family)
VRRPILFAVLLPTLVLAFAAQTENDRAHGHATRPPATTSRAAPQRRPHPHVSGVGRAVARISRRTPYVVSGGGERREIALTFDDGPGPYTPRVLAVLRRLHVPATFFTVGFMVPDFARALHGELRMGAVIGDHTETHAPLARLSPRAQRRQILVQTEQLRRTGAPFPRLLRPPYGSWNRATLRLARHFHMLVVLWSIDSEDYRQPGVGAIVRGVLSRAKSGAIVLLHDAGGRRSCAGCGAGTTGS